MKIHLLDTNNNKTYCGLNFDYKYHKPYLINDLGNDETEVDCKNCLKVVNSIRRKVSKVGEIKERNYW